MHEQNAADIAGTTSTPGGSLHLDLSSAEPNAKTACPWSAKKSVHSAVTSAPLSATRSATHDPMRSQASPLTSQAHLPCCGGAGGATDCPGIFTVCPGMLTLGFPSS